MKKFICIIMLMVLVISFASISLAADYMAGDEYYEVAIDPALPEGQYLYIHAQYDSSAAQYQMLAEYLAKEGIDFSEMTVLELGVWDSNLGDWIAASDAAADGTEYTITLPESGDIILHNSAMTGGTEELGGGNSVTTDSFGLFGIVKAGGGAANMLPWIIVIIAAAVVIIVVVVVVNKKKKNAA